VLAALACDRTRIASLQYARSFSNHKHTWLGVTGGHHDISHNAGATKILTDIQRWYMSHFASLVDGMKKVNEGAGTLLDNTLVVYCAELYTPVEPRGRAVALLLRGQGGRRLAAHRPLPGLRGTTTTTTSS
jgi:hypothetical protein